MFNLLITQRFTSGPMIDNVIIEKVSTNCPDEWLVGTEKIDYITEMPFVILDMKYLNN